MTPENAFIFYPMVCLMAVSVITAIIWIYTAFKEMRSID